MSLEAPGFIKDLIPTNPEGTDPKSQGDDHLRLIKQCLLNQFPGFTEGKAIDLTESQLNALGGLANRFPVANIDVVMPYTAVRAYIAGVTGTLVPGAAVGDVILNLAVAADLITQVWYARGTGTAWMRYYSAGTWKAWTCLSSIGMGQSWIQPGRAFNTNYTNTTGRPIMVNVVGNASSAASGMSMYVAGVMIAQGISQNSILPCFLSGIVPPNAAYAVNISQPTSMTVWTELR